VELESSLVIFSLFSFLFFIIFVSCFSMGVYLLDYNSLAFEVFLPYYFFSEMPFTFFVDYVSLFFFSAVSLISRVVFLYGKFYIEDSYYFKGGANLINSRFFYLLFLFVISMLFLVFSGS